MAFLEILTRCFKRPIMLSHNQASLEQQTCADWTQTLLVDELGRGVGWSYQNMAAYADQLTGDYIWILDDDDVCTRRTLVYELTQIAQAHNPDVIMVRMNHQERGILPDAQGWKVGPIPGLIGCSAYVVRREVFQRHAGAFLSAGYASDFDFIYEIFTDETLSIFWHDVIASQVQWIGLGRPEATEKDEG
jgi:hypothetical protein